jgi:hypothetical protein
MAVFYFLNRGRPTSLQSKGHMPKIFLSQAYIYNLIKPALPIMELLADKESKPTQSSVHEAKKFTTVLVLEDVAYWIKDNKVYSASILEDKIDGESTSVVDTMGMDEVELNKMIFIIDKLTEGANNDRSDSGNKEF